MTANINSHTNKLGIFSLATLLVSAHYGLGFLLGTAEQAMRQGIQGSLYAISLGLGFLALLILAKFYWQQVEPIWTLLGKRYGKLVEVGVGLMSWMSLIGIEAVQIISGAAILAVVGIPKITSMLALAVLFCLLSLLPVEKVSWVLRGLLLFNILALVYSLWALQGLPILVQSPVEFLTSLPQIAPEEGISIVFCTVMLVTIDMKCQQYLVRAKDVGTAIWSCILTAVVLILLALLAGTMAIAARQTGIFPSNLDGKEVIPYILAWVSGGTQNFLGLVASATLAVPALGLGSSVLRVQTRTCFDLDIFPPWLSQPILVTAINVLLALTIAIRGGEIVSLIVLFYAAYLSAAWIPFIAYLLDYFAVYVFSCNSVRLSLLMGSISALGSLLLTLVRPEAVLWGSERLTVTILGIGMATFSLVVNELAEKLLLTPGVEKETGN